MYDWSPDGKALLVSQINDATGLAEIWQLPLAVGSAESAARKIASDPNYFLWEPRSSHDGKWIAFEAKRTLPQRWDSTIYVVAATGGPWIRITDSKQWDDKPRWSPDGKILYFLSDHAGFFNLWAVRFDPAKGNPLGEPFAVTSFESRALMIPRYMPGVDISLTEDRLVMAMAQVSGSIWILDNIDR